MTNIELGEHFWGKIDGKLVVVFKNFESEYFRSGWDVPISESRIVFIQKIALPDGFTKEDLHDYYKD